MYPKPMKFKNDISINICTCFTYIATGLQFSVILFTIFIVVDSHTTANPFIDASITIWIYIYNKKSISTYNDTRSNFNQKLRGLYFFRLKIHADQSHIDKLQFIHHQFNWVILETNYWFSKSSNDCPFVLLSFIIKGKFPPSKR